MKLSFSQCSLLSSVKNGDLSTITQQVEELARAVQIFVTSDTNFRQHLYTFTFSYIIQTLQGHVIEAQPQNVIIEIIQAIREFKSELFDLVAQNPNMPFFDFMVSQQFNDLYDVLTASEKQLNGQLEPVTPRNNQAAFRGRPEIYFEKQTRLRSQSMGGSCPSLQQNNLETNFAMLQQFVYDQMQCDSPRVLSKQNPQLFSFDSTFVRDLPLSKFNGTSNYDDSQFNFTLQKESTADAIQTSRFESQRIEEEEYFGTESSSDLDRSYREWDARFRLLAEKEKQVAQRELKTIIQEKHLFNRTRSQILASPNNKENSNTLSNDPYKVVRIMETTYQNKEQTFKNGIIKRIDVFVSGINENQQMNYIPIQQRAQLLMQEKQQRIAENKRLKEMNEEQELSRYSFRPNIGKEREHRTVDQFLEEVDYWIGRKNEAIHQLQQEKQQQEQKNLTFKPTINKKSQRIVQDQNLSMQDRSQKTIFNKQFKEQQYLIEELKKTPFCPQLNATSVKLLKQTATPERCKTPTQFGEYTPRIGKSPYKKQDQRVSTQATPNKHRPTKSIVSTAVSSNNNSKKEVLPLQNVTNHMKFIVDLINKPTTKPLF